MNIDILRIIGAATDKLLAGSRSIYLDLTTACNINCNFCWIHSPLIKKRVYKKELFLDFNTIKNVIDTASRWKTEEILLSGDGEPTLHPEIKNIINSIKERKVRLFLATNATFPQQLLPSIAKIDYLYVDLCSPDANCFEKFQSPRNKGLYQKVINNLKVLSLNSKRTKSYLNIAFIINKTNYKEIPRMLEFSEKIRINEMTFRIMEATRYTKELLLTNKDKERLVKIIKDILKQKYNFRHNLKKVHLGLTNYKESPYNITKCLTGWFSLLVDVNKDVGICCHNENLVIGNLKNGSLEKIWQSKKAQRMRLICKHKFDLNKYPFKEECQWCHWHRQNNDIIKEIERLKNLEENKKIPTNQKA